MPGDRGSFEAVYHDVPERRLALVGASLTRRLENGKGIWRLELPRLDGEVLEIKQVGGPASPPPKIRKVIPAFLRGTKTEPVLETHEHARQEEPAETIGFLRAMLERQYAEILRHDPGVRLDLDPEDVHRLRVAIRRARAALRAARPLLDPQWSEPLRAELKWLGGSLGPRRDLDVLVARLREQIADLDQPERTAATALVDMLEQERDGAQALAVQALSSERYYGLLDALEAAARGPRVRTAEVSLRRLAGREFKRLRKVARALGPESTDDELHRARILGKRTRYAAELAEPELGKPARKVVACAKRFQDVLGAHQDAIVAEARLRGLLAAQAGSGAAFAAGRLVEAERTRRARAREELPKAWRALDRAARRAWA